MQIVPNTRSEMGRASSMSNFIYNIDCPICQKRT